ncbi:MAG: prefoldin subunit alpha [Thermoplasmata archaeon]|nr:prefoldin subunit alpha [Thermoplasmata archaeon]
MAEEVGLQQAVTALETTRAHLEALTRQEEALRFSLQEYARARDTMAVYKDAPVGTEILVPIGGNSFLFAQIADVDRCIVGLGAEVALDDSIESAIDRLDNRIRQLTTVQEDLLRRMAALEGQANDQAAVVQEAYGKAQDEAQGRDGV